MGVDEGVAGGLVGVDTLVGVEIDEVWLLELLEDEEDEDEEVVEEDDVGEVVEPVEVSLPEPFCLLANSTMFFGASASFW